MGAQTLVRPVWPCTDNSHRLKRHLVGVIDESSISANLLESFDYKFTSDSSCSLESDLLLWPNEGADGPIPLAA